MRISTTSYTGNALYYMEQLSNALAKTQAQLSSGTKLQSAADDPAGMAQVNALNVQVSASQQYVSNGNALTTGLQLSDQALTDATNTLQSARDLAIEANNSALSAAQRQDIATQLQQQLEDLVSIGNRVDGSGRYLFGGYADSSPPFSQTSAGVSYLGAQDVRQVPISASQQVAAGNTGQSVFMNIPAGNGTFVAAAGAGNTGAANIGSGSVTDPAQWVPDTYTVTFTSATQYTVTNSAGTQVASGNFVSGQAIQFAGVQVSVSGTPATNDTFSVTPAGTASVFDTVQGLITTLKSKTLNQGQLASAINGALSQMDGALQRFATVQASFGARLNAITSTQQSAKSAQTTLKTAISQISDTDYAAAVTQLSNEQIGLQATQQSYALIAKLSLFNYIA